MGNIPGPLNDQINIHIQPQEVPHGFTDRNPRSNPDFNPEQGVPPIAHFDDAKINQISPNQNIIPMRKAQSGRIYYIITLIGQITSPNW